MVDKSLKYYDEENLYPKSEYMREDHTKTKIWGIRLTDAEIETWKEMKLSKKIHQVLAGEDQFEIKESLDTRILEKMIPKFIEYGINLETTTEKEDNRIMELIEKCL